MKGLLVLSLVPWLASASPIFGVDTIHNEAAPVLSSIQSQEIPDSYIVVFKKDVSHATINEHHEWVQIQHAEVEKGKRDLHKRSQTPLSVFRGVKDTFNIAGSLLGYSGHFDEDVIERVRRHPDVGIRIHHRLLHIQAVTHGHGSVKPIPLFCDSNYNIIHRTLFTDVCPWLLGCLCRERFRSPYDGR